MNVTGGVKLHRQSNSPAAGLGSNSGADVVWTGAKVSGSFLDPRRSSCGYSGDRGGGGSAGLRQRRVLLRAELEGRRRIGWCLG